MIGKFRKIPVEIEAVKWTGDNVEEINEWLLEHYATHIQKTCREFVFDNDTITIKTLEGPMICTVGNWIIRGVEGEYYPCKDSVFRATYTEVTVNNGRNE